MENLRQHFFCIDLCVKDMMKQDKELAQSYDTMTKMII